MTTSKMVPVYRVGCLGAKSNEYTCLSCGLMVTINPRSYGGMVNRDLLTCPVCESKAKTPTEKLDIEELEKRKAEIRERSKNEIQIK